MEMRDFERLLVARAHCERVLERLNLCVDQRRLMVHDSEMIASTLMRAATVVDSVGSGKESY